MTRRRWIQVGTGAAVSAVALYTAFTLWSWTRSNSTRHIIRWFNDRAARPGLTTTAADTCPDAPFALPSEGFIGLLYADPAGPYNVINRHTGIDIFGDGPPGTVPIVAAYDGLLTRLPSWRSTVIIRHEDPLVPGRIIWTYYTHMATTDGSEDFILPEFPPGTTDAPVEKGQLIGYQGDYGGTRRVGLHLHFSIVTSDETGAFLNEAVLRNTVDPSPYFGLPLHIRDLPQRPVRCTR